MGLARLHRGGSFSSMAAFVVDDGLSGRTRSARSGAAIAGLAFVYSLWMIGGAGADVVYWGFLLLLAGLPVLVRGAGRQNSGLYYVQSVTHRISRDGYSQSFSAWRNAVGLTGAEVFIDPLAAVA